MPESSPFFKKIPTEAVLAIGAIVVCFFFAFYMFTAMKKNSVNTKTNHYFARFNDIDGISVGSDVKIAGYKVGSVEEISVMNESFDVKIKFSVQSNITIPLDSTIAVRTSGLFGGKFLAILAGAEEDFLKNGDEAIYTQGAMNLENLIGTFINK